MNAIECFRISQRIIEIKASQLSRKNGKFRYRELTPEEAEELAALNKGLAFSFSGAEWDLFSGAIESEGGIVIEKTPKTSDECQVENIIDFLNQLSPDALKEIINRIGKEDLSGVKNACA